MNLSDRFRTTSSDMDEVSGYMPKSAQQKIANPNSPLPATTGGEMPSVGSSMQEGANANEEPSGRGVKSIPQSTTNSGIVLNIQTNDAQVVIDYLDQVRKSCVPYLRSLGCRTQVLARSCTDGQLRNQGLQLLSEACTIYKIIPSSYILRPELLRVGRAHYTTNVADMNDGEYMGRPVAVKHLKTDKWDATLTFRVASINLAHYHCSTFN